MSKVGIGIGEAFPVGDSTEPWAEDEREAANRSFKEKLRAAIYDAIAGDDRWVRYGWGYSWRPPSWQVGGFGIGIAALAFALHRHGDCDGGGGCRHDYGSDEPIITPPPSRET